jgi:hypothetical protein
MFAYKAASQERCAWEAPALLRMGRAGRRHDLILRHGTRSLRPRLCRTRPDPDRTGSAARARRPLVFRALRDDRPRPDHLRRQHARDVPGEHVDLPLHARRRHVGGQLGVPDGLRRCRQLLGDVRLQHRQPHAAHRSDGAVRRALLGRRHVGRPRRRRGADRHCALSAAAHHAGRIPHDGDRVGARHRRVHRDALSGVRGRHGTGQGRRQRHLRRRQRAVGDRLEPVGRLGTDGRLSRRVAAPATAAGLRRPARGLIERAGRRRGAHGLPDSDERHRPRALGAARVGGRPWQNG